MNIIRYLTSKLNSVPQTTSTCEHGISKTLLCTHCIDEFTQNFHAMPVEGEDSAYLTAAKQLEAVADLLRQMDFCLQEGGIIDIISGDGSPLGTVTLTKAHKD
jgi:hypothetical protein